MPGHVFGWNQRSIHGALGGSSLTIEMKMKAVAVPSPAAAAEAAPHPKAER
jgi:hypothetical protein